MPDQERIVNGLVIVNFTCLPYVLMTFSILQPKVVDARRVLRRIYILL